MFETEALVPKKLNKKNQLINIFRQYHINIPDEISLYIIKIIYTYHFENNNELKEAIEDYPENIDIYGDCKYWDVYLITDMSNLFRYKRFNGDISDWDVSNVTDMSGMFKSSKFNGNISKWDVSNVQNMSGMFQNSRFNGNISEWNVSMVKKVCNIFKGSNFHGNISKWNVLNVRKRDFIFSSTFLKNGEFNDEYYYII